MKKISLLTFVLFIICVQNTFAQRLISDSVIARYSKNQLNSYFTNNGVPISSPTGVVCYRVIYETQNAQQTDTTIASGLVIIPDTQTCPFPVAMYDHGTTLQRTDVPSYLNYESLLVMILAGNGYFAIAPDYLGLGESPGFHPYVHARSEAQAGIDLIFAAKQLAASKNVELSQQLFLTGYSQGGHACMATHRAIQQNYAGQLTVTASAPGSGPYNMSGIQSAGLADDSFYAEPAYIPFLIFSYQSVYGNLYDSVQQIFLHPYDSILPPLYYPENISTTTINAMLPNHIDSILVASQLQQYINDSATDPLRIDLRDNDVYAWVPKAPILMTYCTQDEQVDYQNTLFTESYFLANGDSTAQDVDGGAYTHENCVTPYVGNMLTFFSGFLVAENNLVVTLSGDTESAPGAANGSATVSVSGGTGYTLLWSNGSTTSTITGLKDDTTYTVTVTDAKGCTKVRSITIGTITGINNINGVKPQVQIFPNPASNTLSIKTTDFLPLHIAVYNVEGQLVTESSYTQQLNVANLTPGVYLIQINGSNNTLVRSRFVKI